MKHLTLFFLIALNSLHLHAQDSWFWRNPVPQGNDLLDVFVLNQCYEKLIKITKL